MAEHLVQLWIRSDDDPSAVDWEAWLPESVNLEHVQTRTFPWSDVQHEINWWITRRLTPDEWNELDNAESEVLARIVGDDNFAGTAGPIPCAEQSETADDEAAEVDAGEFDAGHADDE
jgi:hypothetical protein